jgi:hypothetical protein
LSGRQFTGKAGKYMVEIRGRNRKWGDINVAALEARRPVFYYTKRRIGAVWVTITFSSMFVLFLENCCMAVCYFISWLLCIGIVYNLSDKVRRQKENSL